ncbi:MAG: metal-dependent hydrolase [Chloroflexi bacterium]|nr:metal-dependent hydrolase [Chloroflexota bacterium]
MTKITYLGHSCFKIEREGAQIVTDPFLTYNPLAAAKPDQLSPNLILVSHAHGDHMGDAASISQRTGAPVLAIFETAGRAAQAGAKTVGAGYGGTVSFDFGKVKLVPAWHSSSFGDEFQYAGNPCGFVIMFPDITIYDAGDTTVFGDMKLIAEVTPIDIALLPIGGHYTMGVDDAVKAVELLKPKVVIPMHYNTLPEIRQDPQEFKDKVESRLKTKVVILKPGESYTA